MNAELKAKWIAALRSGEFKQGVGRLCDPVQNTYCCLGVLCEVMGIPRTLRGNDITFLGSACVLPSSVGDRAALDEGSEETLIGLNDTGTPFANIATWIEENL